MAHDLKQQQISSLFAHNGSVTTIIEGQQYEVSCVTVQTGNSNANNIQLLVNLPPSFPEEAPVLTVSPTGLLHPWVDSDVIINEALTMWSYQSNLGMLVHDICEEFRLHPPGKKNNGTDESYGHRPPPPLPATLSSSSSSTMPTSTTSNMARLSSLSNPQTVNAEYMTIVKKSTDELEELLSNETAFDLFFDNLDRVKNLKTVQEELRNGNENLAHKNLSLEDALIKLRSEVQDLNTEYTSLKSLFMEKERLQQEAFNRFSSSTVLTRLKAGVYESDDLSESVAQSFLEGSLDHDSFVKQFRELRKVYHLRASKLEKLQKNSLFSPS